MQIAQILQIAKEIIIIIIIIPEILFNTERLAFIPCSCYHWREQTNEQLSYPEKVDIVLIWLTKNVTL